MTFQDSIDKFKQYCNFPSKYTTPEGIREQEDIYNECCIALGPHKFKGLFDKFIDKNRGYEVSFKEFKKEVEVKNAIVNQKHYAETIALTKANPAITEREIPDHLKPKKPPGSANLWDLLNDYEEYDVITGLTTKVNQIQNISNDNVKFYPKLYEILKEQIPEFMGIGEPTDYMIKYISSAHIRPLVIGSEKPFAGYRLLRHLQSKVANTTQYVYISPSKPNYRICFNSVWEDFEKTVKWDESIEAYIDSERSASSFGNSVGLFYVSVCDDIDNYHEKFKKLLQFFVGSGKKIIVAIPKVFEVGRGHWLRQTLQDAITVDLDRTYR